MPGSSTNTPNTHNSINLPELIAQGNQKDKVQIPHELMDE